MTEIASAAAPKSEGESTAPPYKQPAVMFLDGFVLFFQPSVSATGEPAFRLLGVRRLVNDPGEPDLDATWVGSLLKAKGYEIVEPDELIAIPRDVFKDAVARRQVLGGGLFAAQKQKTPRPAGPTRAQQKLLAQAEQIRNEPPSAGDTVQYHPTQPTLPLPLVTVLAPKKVTTLSRVRRRLIEPIEDESGSLAFQHTVLCQTGLPYRNPGDDVRIWEREQGDVSLLVEAGRARNPKTEKWVELGLPWGTKPRLILAHLNAEALRRGSPVIEVESSLSAFVKRIRGFDGGREIRLFKDQLSRLSVALVRLAMTQGDRAFQVNTQVVTAFELWPELDDRQRVLWPSTIRLSADYFNSLQEHAVPLWEEDLAALAHSAMALDIYAWLAQRLHRIKLNKPDFIAWSRLKDQFGPDHRHMRKFKAVFRVASNQVLTRYRVAWVELDGRGMTLHNSPPPVPKRMILLPPRTWG